MMVESELGDNFQQFLYKNEPKLKNLKKKFFKNKKKKLLERKLSILFKKYA